MNLKCLICSELLTPSTQIHATNCGHLFHFHCIVQWLEQSKSCPQCRNKVTTKSIFKIYVCIEENPDAPDYSTLQNKVESLEFLIKLKDKEIQGEVEKSKDTIVQNDKLRKTVVECEDSYAILQSSFKTLRDQVSFLKNKCKNEETLKEEIAKLKVELREMENVRLVISGSKQQVSDMLRQNHDVQSLSLLITTLKKELIDSDRKLKQVKNFYKETKNELHANKQNVAELQRLKIKLEKDLEAHQSCEEQRMYLKQKIEDLQSAISSPSVASTSIRRIIEESPAPFKSTFTACEDLDKSLTVPEKVKAIKSSDSPYLQLQSSSIGLNPFVKLDSKHKFSIFKQPIKMKSSKMPAEQIYDGLGGHSKEELFPSPISTQKGLKRPKSTSTITSAKFRKLAPNQRTLSFQ